jgi:pyruvate decarboxylase
LAKVFGPSAPSQYWGPVETPDQLEEVLKDQEFNEGAKFRLLELKLGYLDAPISIKMAGQAVEEFNKRNKKG